MDEKLRNPQTINGEMFPRNFFIGRESCRRLNDMIAAFKAEGINLHAIPLIKEVEQGYINEDMKPGTVIGVRPPTNENDPAGVLVWDGFGIVGVSFMVFHRKEREGWTFNDNDGTSIPPDKIEKGQTKTKKKKRTTPKHERKKQYKSRNGRKI